MLKFLLIVLIIGYVFFKGLGFIMRTMFGVSGRGTAQNFNREYQTRRSNSGNVDVNYDPRGKSKKGKANFKGGEYVDFEEVE
ncbi:MAG: DUF4834 family protein [Bacteroidota bacterium]